MLPRSQTLQRVGLAAGVRHSSTSSQTFVKRVTLFKIPKEADIDATLKQYEVLRKTARKDGKPYIVSNVARRVLNTSSPRSEGFTVSSQSIFTSHDDHDFYDNECKAHQELRLTRCKQITAKVRTGIMTIVTEGPWPEPEL